MNTFVFGAMLFSASLIVVALYRIWVGPTVFDRILAVSLVTANSLVVLLLIGAYFDRMDAIVDIAIAYALLAFTLPVALAKHFESRSVFDVSAGTDQRALIERRAVADSTAADDRTAHPHAPHALDTDADQDR